MGNASARGKRGNRSELLGARDEDTQKEGRAGVGEGKSCEASRSDSSESMAGPSPPGSPRRTETLSPLLFTPQIPMTPIPKVSEVVLPPYSYPMPNDSHSHGEDDDVSVNPALILWTHGGTSVSVKGSWDNWEMREPLHVSGNDFALIKWLPSGIFQYKFIVDENWQFAPDLPSVRDEKGNINNVLEVQEDVSENFENLAGFEAPSSPNSSYDNARFAAEDFTKEPPPMPSQLHLTVLNVTEPTDSYCIPRPQHVLLNHVYVEKGGPTLSGLALGTTQRYRSKYVTVVLYKPFRT